MIAHHARLRSSNDSKPRAFFAEPKLNKSTPAGATTEESSALSERLAERGVFALVALILASLLSLRPIPSILSANDTGRYVAEFVRGCSAPIDPANAVDFTWLAYHVVSRPFCGAQTPEALLIAIALAIPIALLISARWGHLNLIWSVALLVSFPWFEFATNALRQGLSTAFVIIALYGALKNRHLMTFLATCAGIAFHASAIVYAPFIGLAMLANKDLRLGLANASLAVIIAGALAGAAWFHLGDSISEILRTRAAWYEQPSSASFLAFVLAPSVYVLGVRLLGTRGVASRLEWVFLAYSVGLAAISLAVFPAILYRFALTNAVIQLVLASASRNSTNVQGALVFLGLSAHLIVYLMISEYARGVFGI